MSGQEGKIVANDQPANLVCSHHVRSWHIAVCGKGSIAHPENIQRIGKDTAREFRLVKEGWDFSKELCKEILWGMGGA